MGFGDVLRRVFGGGGGGSGEAAAGEPVDYKGFTIRPAPQRTASGWNTAGVISKPSADGVRETPFVRVDTHMSRDDAIVFSVTKAQQIIDEQGERIFKSR